MGVRTTKTAKLTAATPIGDVVRCHRGITRSEAGPCKEGQILHKLDRRVQIASECFMPVFPDCVLPWFPEPG